jgi:hypothetical protein
MNAKNFDYDTSEVLLLLMVLVTIVGTIYGIITIEKPYIVQQKYLQCDKAYYNKNTSEFECLKVSLITYEDTKIKTNEDLNFLKDHCIETDNNKCKTILINSSKKDYESFKKGMLLKVDVLGNIKS